MFGKLRQYLYGEFHYALVAIVFLVGSLATLSIFYFVYNKLVEVSVERFVNDARYHAFAIQRIVDNNLLVLRSIESFFNATGTTEPSEFKKFVRPFLQRQFDIQTLDWVAKVSRGQGEKFVSSDLEVKGRVSRSETIPSPGHEDYYPLYYIEPYSSGDNSTGYDLAADPLRKQALEKARDSGDIISTPSTMMVFQANHAQRGFYMFLPIYRQDRPSDTISARRDNLLGFVIGVYRIKELFESGLRNISNKPIEIKVYDLDVNDNATIDFDENFLYHYQFPSEVNAEEKYKHAVVSYDFKIKVADRYWLLRFSSSPDYYMVESIWLAWIILLGGLTITLLITIYLQSVIKNLEITDKLAHYDSLTQLPNRLHFESALDQAFIHSERYKDRFSLVYFDLDNFKEVNDTLGHDAGDLLLKEVAARIRSCLRKSDFIARLGGDEFAIILYGVKDKEGSNISAQKLVDAFRLPFNIKNRQVYTSASVGIANFPNDGADAVTLIKNADIAMYRIKKSGRNNFQQFSEMK